jgi:putative DNA primase/helicase
MSGPAIDRVLQRLTGVKQIPTGWMARCPAHDDKNPSLHISEHPDLSVGLHCYAGCEKSALLTALGLTFADLFSPPPNEKFVEKTYDYCTIDGTLLYQAIRYWPKEFKQRRPDGKGGWIEGHGCMLPLKGKHVPYRLPDLKGHNVVVVVEGEKDADRLWALGIPATTNVGGATCWTASDSKWLAKAGVNRVVIIPDNDEAGHKRIEIVGRSVKLVQIATSVIELPNLGPGEDVSDWLINGGSKEDLQNLIAAKPYVLAQSGAAPIVTPDAVPDVEPIDPHNYHHQKDDGAAKLWRDRHQDLVRYDHQRKDWLVWDNHFWRPDANEAATRLAMEHIQLLQQDALQEPDWQRREKLLQFAVARMRKGARQAMMDTAKALLPIALAGDTWDQNGWLLGCPNGVLDLKTLQLRAGARDDLITLQTAVPYDADAPYPRWKQFLEEVFEDDTELIHYVHKALGYSLTADMREQCFFVGHGAGANGKSIFLDTLEQVFGTYGQRADMRMFAGFTSDSNSFQTADFRGKRMVYASEVRKGGRMNEHVIKHFIGGETIRGEYKFGKSFTMRPVGKIWLGVNDRPRVADESKGFWRRVRLIPFKRTFDGSTDDKVLRDALLEERVGILAWLVKGCQLWQEEKLVSPKAVVEASEEYKTDEDPIAEFVEVLEVTASDEIGLFADIVEAYSDWAKRHGVTEKEKLSGKALSSSLQARGLKKEKLSGNIYFYGIRAKSKAPQQQKLNDFAKTEG